VSKPQWFKKKPVAVQAMQYTGPKTKLAVREFVTTPLDERAMEGGGFGLLTNNGWVTVRPGDWIVRTVLGDFYPCSADVFAANHEPLPTTPTEGR
jgi:hypothetical protein